VPGVLLGSPVRKPAAVVRAFLYGLMRLDTDDLRVDWLFIDDNDDRGSSQLLASARNSAGHITVRPLPASQRTGIPHEGHQWPDALVRRVADMKDGIIEEALSGDYDHLLLVDADLVLRPPTLLHLLSLTVPIVSEVFWTRWHALGAELPNVWVTDHYTLYRSQRGERLSREEAEARTRQFLSSLRQPGLFPVGGLGACTLIERRALEAGARFALLPNLTWWGEDRHFCLRAAALGFDLWADTHHPPLHLYRDADLRVLPDWLRAQGMVKV
jgi:hypothetical protein